MPDAVTDPVKLVVMLPDNVPDKVCVWLWPVPDPWLLVVPLLTGLKLDATLAKLGSGPPSTLANGTPWL